MCYSTSFKSGVVVDTNVLLLYIVGLTDRSYIQSFKITRSAGFREKDWDTLDLWLGKFSTIWITGGILAEVSNHLGKMKDQRGVRCHMMLMRFVSNMEESHFDAIELIKDESSFLRLGYTDTSLVREASLGRLVLTDDAKLANRIYENDWNVVNFNQIRDLV